MFYQVKDLQKIYPGRLGGQGVMALQQISFSLDQGDFLAIMGESGSGKTTLINLMALLDQPTAGEIILKGQRLTDLSDRQAAQFRRDHIGFVFQQYNLLDTLTVGENILLPLVLQERELGEMEARLAPLLRKLGLEDLRDHYPYELSGGEQQRVAVARALITEPEIIFADEPTGALDSSSADSLLSYFRRLNEGGQTLLMVTHSIKAASYARRVLFIKDGRIFHQIFREDQNQSAFYEQISNTMAQLAGGISCR